VSLILAQAEEAVGMTKVLMGLGLTGFSLLINVLLTWRLMKAEDKYDALQDTRIKEKDDLLKALTNHGGGT
jgi:hypothetical protein